MILLNLARDHGRDRDSRLLLNPAHLVSVEVVERSHYAARSKVTTIAATHYVEESMDRVIELLETEQE